MKIPAMYEMYKKYNKYTHTPHPLPLYMRLGDLHYLPLSFFFFT